ncbi:DUF2116 family Zn-ribbon domain-containing protein [Pasteurella multocida subsp. multocida]|uniref:DUF2116 family Zn-ribbon domain-containing protein n=1 Tax=Pasteurella multocida TaxID=747 RepID=UPI0003ADC177|nr:DUF2116 family Zn-ribbon domain-containing protein [Pasteurella multocida]ERL42239.1 hypothetical protein B654_03471 [Pasteurella multocida subsp. multocida str. PMTB]MCZ2905917.1 DUF2116 family Zn-ribbon domain-containing protein [Pasteurella multocida]MDV6009586.1 DUF2116 family Zn-ribbon domain-containing protein [Pasteurella multocida subsp. multocida]ODN37943.1 hypothetical protein BGC42_05025 [Pasteurella multocida]
MDDIDKASQTEAFLLHSSIETSRKNQAKSLGYTGLCYYCDEPLPEGQLFCDSDCRDDYEWHQKLKKQKIM